MGLNRYRRDVRDINCMPRLIDGLVKIDQETTAAEDYSFAQAA
jgi:hypothetical protein